MTAWIPKAMSIYPPPTLVRPPLVPGFNEPTRTKRAIGIDVARAVALIGMVAVHIYPLADANNVKTWAFEVFGGRAAALFALLAGVSIAFVERRSRGKLYGRNLWADRGALVSRGLLIMLAGLLLAYLDTDVDIILPYFGFLFLLVIPFYGRSNGLLLISGVLFATLGPVLLFLVGHNLPAQPDPTANYTLTTVFQHPVPFLADLLLTGYYPTLLWMAYICVGIVIGRQVLTSKTVALTIAAWGAGLALSTWFLSYFLLGQAGGLQRLVEATPTMTSAQINDLLAYGPPGAPLMPDTTWWWQAAIGPYSNTPLNVVHNLGAAMAVTGVALLLTRSGGTIFSPLAAMGAMTLTLYSAHLIVLWLDVLDSEQPLVSLCIMILSFLLFALVWRSSMGRGPLERIVADASDWVRKLIRQPEEKRWLRPRKHVEDRRRTIPAGADRR
ncbi:heparan-alpha-glucosaminide N-acetyltransferase domain-containing protein [Arthrobacter sp. USHLN218]|uniref:heparan-alpha-glucosaminide N-acetyltransferase domain-containing protein n=1 Tax=Arthrobacter sp. USHLN218 TaxID=3081232 RepID=UPI003019322D